MARDFFYHTESHRIALSRELPRKCWILCDGVYLNRSVMKISNEIRSAVMQATMLYAREGCACRRCAAHRSQRCGEL
jgi:hypothetical protein